MDLESKPASPPAWYDERNPVMRESPFQMYLQLRMGIASTSPNNHEKAVDYVNNKPGIYLHNALKN